MSDLLNITKKLKDILEKEQINEMSLAWDYRNKKSSCCAWVEGPMQVDNRYFKYYNNESPSMATKVARIRIDKPEYVGGNHRENQKQGKVEKWVLNEKEKRFLIELLNSPSDDNENCTKWQDILIRWNRDNFGIPAVKTIKSEIEGYKAKSGLLNKLKPFSIDTPMPDYLRLN